MQRGDPLVNSSGLERNSVGREIERPCLLSAGAAAAAPLDAGRPPAGISWRMLVLNTHLAKAALAAGTAPSSRRPSTGDPRPALVDAAEGR